MVTDEQITLYAIGAMDAGEAAEFERQVATSAALRERVAEEMAAAAALLMAAEPITPPPALKDKVMARVGADATIHTVTTRARVGQDEQKPRANLRDVWRYLLGGLSVGLAAVALVLGTILANTQARLTSVESQLVTLQQDAASARDELQSTSARADQLERDLARARADADVARLAAATAQTNADKAQSDVVAAQSKVETAESQLASVQRELSVLDQADVRIAALPANQTGFETGNVRVFYSPDGKTALFVVSNLPKLSADKDYQVWLIKDKVPLPSSVFDTDTAGTGRFVVESDEPFAAFQNLGITIEPTGGRPTPNPDGPIYLGPIG